MSISQGQAAYNRRMSIIYILFEKVIDCHSDGEIEIIMGYVRDQKSAEEWIHVEAYRGYKIVEDLNPIDRSKPHD